MGAYVREAGIARVHSTLTLERPREGRQRLSRFHLGYVDPSFPMCELFNWLLTISTHRSHLPVQSPRTMLSLIKSLMLRLTRRQSETEQKRR